MTVLTICQNVADHIGVDRPDTVIGNVNQVAKTMLELANQGGIELAKRGRKIGGWSVLRVEGTITTVNGTSEYAVPSDFDFMVPNTAWNRTNSVPVIGPVSPAVWAMTQSGHAVPGIRDALYIRQASATNVKAFYVTPTPGAAETIAFEYISTNWCESSGGSGQAAWAADSDTGILDEYLLELDLRWRYRRSRGLEYADEKAEFEQELAGYFERDGGRPWADHSGNFTNQGERASLMQLAAQQPMP